MELNEYVLTILKNAYHQNTVTLHTPNYRFRFRRTIRLIRTVPSSSVNDGYDTDDNISFDHIIPKRKLNMDDMLYTPQIKKLIGLEMSGKCREWTIEAKDKKYIRVRDLLEIMARLKPDNLVFSPPPNFYIQKLTVSVRHTTMEICLFY